MQTNPTWKKIDALHNELFAIDNRRNELITNLQATIATLQPGAMATSGIIDLRNIRGVGTGRRSGGTAATNRGGGGLRTRVLATIRANPNARLGATAIARELGMPRKREAIQSQLRRLTATKQIRKVGTGYAMPISASGSNGSGPTATQH